MKMLSSSLRKKKSQGFGPTLASGVFPEPWHHPNIEIQDLTSTDCEPTTLSYSCGWKIGGSGILHWWPRLRHKFRVLHKFQYLAELTHDVLITYCSRPGTSVALISIEQDLKLARVQTGRISGEERGLNIWRLTHRLQTQPSSVFRDKRVGLAFRPCHKAGMKRRNQSIQHDLSSAFCATFAIAFLRTRSPK